MRTNDTPRGAMAITPSDTATRLLIGFYVGGAGNVTVVDSLGTTTTFANVPAGQFIALQINKIKATGTTASNIVGFVE
jgi:hypothetical protein